MARKATLIVLLVLTLFFFSFPKIIEVNAQTTIYIKGDGNVEGTDKIQRDGIAYTFIDNIVNQSIIVERDNIVVDGANYTLEGGHIWLENRRNVTIKNMQIANSDEGIRIMGNSINNTIIGNTIKGIKTTTGNAIWVTLGATNTTIARNNLTGNNIGIYVEMSGGTTISENRFETNGIGIWLSGSQNRIIRNDIISNNRGILVSIEKNYIQHNNFINNSIQGEASPTSSSNTWDDGYPSGGNYWDNYNGTDNNGDGIGDTPYIIDENNQDNYPLMNQSIIPEFPSWIILPLLMITTLTVIVYKKRMLKR